ncbi:MAG: GNAT family N-acetyltransferase [Dehalococcoidia bacterium]|nr:GNAT family N-acetyltransferase [Dehalococcoidia bacterium]
MHDGGKLNWKIRLAERGDVRGIAAILRELGWFTVIDSEAPEQTETRIHEHLRQCLTDDSHTVLVAEAAGGSILGYTAVHWLPYLMLPGSDGYVSELFVTDSARGGGVGTSLLEAVKTVAMRRGCYRLMLVNRKTRESYRRGFYHKLGWEERAEFANFVLHLPVEKT